MSSGKKIFIGIFSILPMLIVTFYLVSFISAMVYLYKDSARGVDPEDFFVSNFGSMVGFVLSMGLLGLLSLAVLIYFIIHAINNTQITSNERIIWILLFVFVGMICFPIYWYMRIWKSPQPAPAT